MQGYLLQQAALPGYGIWGWMFVGSFTREGFGSKPNVPSR